MDDSDDYFDDFDGGIDFADQTVIAALEAEESKFAATQAAAAAAAVQRDRSPPAKKQKVDHSAISRTLSGSQYSGLPDVSDFFPTTVSPPKRPTNTGVVYRTQAPPPRNQNASRAPSVPPPTQTIRQRSNNHVGQVAPVASSSRPTRRVSGPQPAAAQRYGSPALEHHSSQNQGGHNGKQAAVSPVIEHRPPLSQARRHSGAPPAHTVPRPPGPVARQQSLQRQPSFNAGTQAPPRATQGGGDLQTRLELSILKGQMEELKAREGELVEKLKEAQNARYAKEGEVSILRASMSKSAQDHQAELARLQAAKEAAEAAKLQLVQEQKDEIERLKTQFTFRQHELETTTRRPPWSVRTQKIRQGLPPTPVKMPSSMRAWNPQGEGPSAIITTPRRPRFGEPFSPLPSQAWSRKMTAEPLNRTAMKPALPGFINSFADTPSKPPSQRLRDKGKGRQREPLDSVSFFASEGPGSSPFSSPLARPRDEDHPMDDIEPLSLVREANDPVSSAPNGSPEDDKMTVDDEDNTEDHTASEIEPPNWRDELLRILFGHIIAPESTPTLQLLLASAIPPSASIELHQAYTSACSKLLDHLSVIPRSMDWDTYLNTFCNLLIDLGRVLTSFSAVPQLSALFLLICTLSHTIPSFAATVMSVVTENMDPRIIGIVCDVAREHLGPPLKRADHERMQLAHATLSLLEALSWNVPEPSVQYLSNVIRGHQILANILAQSHPTDVLAHAVRTLALFATHTSLFRVLLSQPYDVDGHSQHLEGRSSRILPHIEALCNFLTEAAFDGPEHDELKYYTLTLLATLSIADTDAAIILLRSPTLIPSLILYLSNISAAFWEGDDAIIESRAFQSKTVERMLRTIALLYHLVFSPPTPYDIAMRLRRCTQRQFSGIFHVFTVVMGRFAWAFAPDWLDDERRLQVEQAAEMTGRLMDLVIQSNELDLVWSAFQSESPEGEDEEQEMRDLHE